MHGISNSGPWALAFGYAFSLIVKAWQADRLTISTTLESLDKTLVALNETLKEVLEQARDNRKRFEEMLPVISCSNFSPKEARIAVAPAPKGADL